MNTTYVMFYSISKLDSNIKQHYYTHFFKRVSFRQPYLESIPEDTIPEITFPDKYNRRLKRLRNYRDLTHLDKNKLCEWSICKDPLTPDELLIELNKHHPTDYLKSPVVTQRKTLKNV